MRHRLPDPALPACGPSARSDAARPGLHAVLVVVVVVVALLSGCVGSGKTASGDSIEPLPGNLKVVSDTTTGCRSGESGFDYRFLIVGPTDLSAGSPLLDHIRSRDFVRTGPYTDDLSWVSTGYQHDQYPIRIEAGTLDTYLKNAKPFTGPPVNAIPEDVKAHAADYVLLALRPTDFLCTTPL